MDELNADKARIAKLSKQRRVSGLAVTLLVSMTASSFAWVLLVAEDPPRHSEIVAFGLFLLACQILHHYAVLGPLLREVNRLSELSDRVASSDADL